MPKWLWHRRAWSDKPLKYTEEKWHDNWDRIIAPGSGWRVVIEIADRLLIVQNTSWSIEDFIFMWKED